MIFSYLNFFVSICQFEAAHVPMNDQKILVKGASASCVYQHTECMLKRLKYNTGWQQEDIQLKAAKCVVDVERKKKVGE